MDLEQRMTKNMSNEIICEELQMDIVIMNKTNIKWMIRTKEKIRYKLKELRRNTEII